MSGTHLVAKSYESLRQGAGILDLSSRSQFVVRGKDGVQFLHNMLTNDIVSLRPGHGCNAVKVSVQGKMEAALRVLRFQDEIRCDLERQALDDILPGLQRRIVLEEAELQEESDRWGLLSLQGPRAAEVLTNLGGDPEALPQMHRHAPAALAGVSVHVVRGDHTGEGGFDLFVPAEALPKVKAAAIEAGAHPVDPSTFNVRRVEAGVPWHGLEITPEHFPQEAGLETGWISYTKGCYLGQETIARIHHLGHVNHLLRGLLFADAELPEPGTSVQEATKDVGVVTSAVHSLGLDRVIALAYLRREHAEPGTEVTVAGARARVAALPFL